MFTRGHSQIHVEDGGGVGQQGRNDKKLSSISKNLRTHTCFITHFQVTHLVTKNFETT